MSKTQAVAFHDETAGSQRVVTPTEPMPVALYPASSTPASATITHFTKTVASAGTPAAMFASATTCRTVVFSPLRTNTGDVYMGASSTNDAQHVVVPGVIVLDAPPGKLLNLADIYLDVTVGGEGVGGYYIN